MPARPKPAARNQKLAPSDRFEWDTEVPGLALRRRPDRKPAWYVQVWTDGRTIRRALGPEATLSLDQARDMARALIAELTGETTPTSLVPKVPKATVAEFAARFLKHGATSWKPATLTAHRSLLGIDGARASHCRCAADFILRVDGACCADRRV